MKDPTLRERKNSLHFRNEIGMYYCGKRVNTKHHSYGPEIRNHYLLVLVNSGEAILHGKTEQRFGTHDLLIMCPDQRIHYDALTEWSISWVGLYGKTVEEYMNRLGVDGDHPILPIRLYSEVESVFTEIYERSEAMTFENDLEITGLLYRFFSLLFFNQNISQKQDLIGTARKIIDYNYNTDLCVSELSESLGVSFAHFSRQFKQALGVSPKQYLLNKRIERAKYLLSSTDVSIGEISNSVGYEDPLYFSRIFKKETGTSPREYRSLCLTQSLRKRCSEE